MDSYPYNYNPLSFCCSNCGESQSKYLPPGTKMTGCGKCGTLVTIANLPQKITTLTPNIQISSSLNRRYNLNRNNIDEGNYLIEDNDDDLYSNPYHRFKYRSPQGRQNNNRTNTNNSNANQQQGMFSLHFPNENFNRHSSNARRFNQDDGLDEEELFDQELENELNQLMQIGQMRLSRQALHDINKLTITNSTKVKIPKSKMNKKLYSKNAKGKLEAPTCCICLNLMKLNDEISIIKCKHMFHYLCLQKWIETKEECPFCRGKLV